MAPTARRSLEDWKCVCWIRRGVPTASVEWISFSLWFDGKHGFAKVEAAGGGQPITVRAGYVLGPTILPTSTLWGPSRRPRGVVKPCGAEQLDKKGSGRSPSPWGCCARPGCRVRIAGGRACDLTRLRELGRTKCESIFCAVDAGIPERLPTPLTLTTLEGGHELKCADYAFCPHRSCGGVQARSSLRGLGSTPQRGRWVASRSASRDCSRARAPLVAQEYERLAAGCGPACLPARTRTAVRSRSP